MMYGPVTIGGPCRRCGVAQIEHAGKSCKDAAAARDARLAAFFAPILKAAVAKPERPKVSYIGAPAVFKLDLACQHINTAFGDHGCYGVGSAWERPDWRDVDVRYIMDDDRFYALFPDVPSEGCNWEFDPRWLLMTTSISEWLKAQTDLPVDFQFQPQTHANARHSKPRHPLGMRLAPRRAAAADG